MNKIYPGPAPGYAQIAGWARASRVLVVASGPSVLPLKRDAERWFERLPRNVTVIAVNGAIEWLPRADYFCSVDTSTLNMTRVANPRPGTIYVMACPPSYPLPAHVIRLVRVERPKVNPRFRLDPNHRGNPGLSETPNMLHTGNSAYGALGLAYFMRPEVIALLGVDGTQAERVEGGTPNRLDHLPRLFATAKEQLDRRRIQVLNGSPESLVTCFPRHHPLDVIKMLGEP